MAFQKELVETIAKSIVDVPAEVNVSVIEGENTNMIELRVNENDYGKVIGKKGRIVSAIRMLLSIASRSSKKRWILDIVDKKEN